MDAPERLFANMDPYGGRFTGLATRDPRNHYTQVEYVHADLLTAATARAEAAEAAVKTARDDALREALKAFDEAENARCESCGHPRSNHPYRHPFISSVSLDPKRAILALIDKPAQPAEGGEG